MSPLFHRLRRKIWRRRGGREAEGERRDGELEGHDLAFWRCRRRPARWRGQPPRVYRRSAAVGLNRGPAEGSPEPASRPLRFVVVLGAESGARPRRPRGLGRGRGLVVVFCRVEPGRASSESSRIQPQRLGHCDRRARALSSQACSSVPCARADQSSVFHQRREKFDAWHNACVTALPGNNSETSAAGTATGTRAPALPSATLQHLFVVALTRTA